MQKLSAYFTAKDGWVPIARGQELKVRDRFGTQSGCEFQKLQEMPLTDTGKIDRDKLSATGRKASAERVAPRTELESKLASIWQEVLGIPQVGIHDNFFELGGSSLLAVQLFTQIEKARGKNLPLSTLFQAATVEQMAALLHQEEGSALSSSLIAIQSGGSKPPLFGVHEVQGHILFYRELARHLGSEQPFYGLQPVGLDGKQAPFTRCEDMAAHYIREMRTIQPEGPYFLVGYSIGGVLAFEMAQQMCAQGEKVALLALIDTYAEGSAEQLSLRERISRQLCNLLQLEPVDILAKSKVKIQRLRNKVQERTQEIARQFYSTNERPLPDTSRHLSIEDFVEEATRQAVKDYVSQVYPGRITFFRAIEPPPFEGWNPDSYLYWSEWPSEGLELYEIPGDHLSMVKEPHVQVLATRIRACLDQAVQEQS